MSIKLVQNKKFIRLINVFLYFKKVLFFLFFFLLTLILSSAGFQNSYFDGRAGFKKYLKNYISTNMNQLWTNKCILQDNRGIIYAGNFNNVTKSGNLHQFDGVSWCIINGPKSGVLSMAIDDAGTIYIGGYNQFGYIVPDSKGVLQYKSLKYQLDDDKKNFQCIYFIHSTKEGVYFTSRNFLFRWNPNSRKIKAWVSKSKGKFLSSFKCCGDLYIQQENIGLMRLENNKLNLVKGGKFFENKQIRMIVPYHSQSILIGTQTSGLYLLEDVGVTPFHSEDDFFLKEKQLEHGIRLRCGNFALATTYGGLIIIDSLGRKKEIFNKSYGLQDNEISYVFEDQEGNLWLAFETGISKIEYRSPISINDNLSLIFYSIIKHKSVLYIGTENGLFTLASDGKFNHIPETSDHYLAMLSIEDSIFATTKNGVYYLNGNKHDVYFEGEIFYSILHSQKEKNRIWVGGEGGLFSLYKKNKKWKKECHFKNITERIESIVEDEKGNLWLGLNFGRIHTNKIVLKVDFPSNGTFTTPILKGYKVTSQKLNYNICWIFKVAGHIIFSTDKGLYRFDEKTKSFIPDLTFGIDFAGSPNTKSLLRFFEDKKKNAWINSRTNLYLATFQKDGTYTIQTDPFQRIQSYYWFPIYPDPYEDATWILDKGKLIRYDTTIKKNYNYSFPTLIRKGLANGSIIYGGNQIDDDKDFQPRQLLPRIPYQDRNLRFEFAAPFFEDETSTQYRYILEGYDKGWSQWEWETKKEYNSLAPGLYKFRAQSKNVYQHPGSEAVFQFRVLLPWYRKWWAILSYAILLFGITYLLVKWRRSFQLEKEKQRLEFTVNERTKEIKIKNQQLELQSEKLKEMDKVKSRFFANISHEFRTPLTLIMGQQEQILSHDHSNLEKKANITLQNSQRLLGLINQLLDLSKLDSGKMKLQACRQNIVSFLKGIVSAFEPLVEKKGQDLNLNIEEERISLFFDPEKMEQIILNLLSNAVKFTPRGGKIILSLTTKSGTETYFHEGVLEISVSDTGPGIPRDKMAHIFDRFYQVDSAFENHPKGSGIGLALAKELVELHHGTLEIQSSEGKGSEFIIRLPMGDSHLNPENIIEQLKKPYQFKNLNDYSKQFSMENEQKSTIEKIVDSTGTKDNTKDDQDSDPELIEAEFSPSKLEKNTILVVEDSADLRTYIRDCLAPDYNVIEARNGSEGIQSAQKNFPDLIISDIMMPEVDGYQLCRQLKNHISTSHIPIILLTAKASEENIIEGLETGADDYITKPFNTKILCARIKNLIDLHNQLQVKRKRQITLQPAELSVSSMDEEFYQELQEVIEKNLSDPEFTVDHLAKKLYMSRTSLYMKILALTGIPPRQFIRTYRLKRAAQLLKANFGNVSEVATEVGFHNIPYFSKCFKDEFHQIPSAYQDHEP